MEKAGDVKAKVNLQPSFYVREIDSRYPKGHRPSAKKDQEDIYWKPRMRPLSIKTRLSPIAPLPLLISLGLKLPSKISTVVGEVIEDILPPGSLLLRL